MNQGQFLDSIGCRFSYTDLPCALELAEVSCRIWANATFAVLDEISRPPCGTPAPTMIRKEVLAYIEDNLDHPLVKLVGAITNRLFDDVEISVQESVSIRKIAAGPGQYGALSLAYVACDDLVGEADSEYSRVMSEWVTV